MERRFVVPAVSFLAPVLIWVAFFVLVLTGNWVQGRAQWPGVAISLVVGGLVLFSAMRCQQAGGPRVGSIARAVALLLMALLSFWKVGIIEACVLLVAALVTGARYFMTSSESEDAGDSSAAASQSAEEPE